MYNIKLYHLFVYKNKPNKYFMKPENHKRLTTYGLL